MAKLWDKGYSLDQEIEQFTVGRDYQLDLNLIEADCIGSIAHGSMLNKIGVLSLDEFSKLHKGLVEIIHLSRKGEFSIPKELEDGHTAIESYLTETCGEVGKKIHTGRSRNDQVLTSTRLWMRSGVVAFLRQGMSLVSALERFAEKHVKTPMPGRTHLQIAMPSSFGLWAAAWAEDLMDTITYGKELLHIIDCSPLGAAASYGSPLPVDREHSSDAMGFSRVQNNVLYVNNSRGKFEAMVMDLLDYGMTTLSKMAQDLMLFSLPEFGYVTLPRELCSGSSIMPQKKNPDGLELIRGKAAAVAGQTTMVKNIIRALPSGYNRDYQETKEPILRALPTTIDSLRIMEITIDRMEVHISRLLESCVPELFATDQVFDMVSKGSTFRDAYKEIGTHPENFAPMDPLSVIENRTSSGEAGNLRLDRIQRAIEKVSQEVDQIESRYLSAMESLVGEAVEPFHRV